MLGRSAKFGIPGNSWLECGNDRALVSVCAENVKDWEVM